MKFISTEKELELIKNALDQSAIVAITDKAGNIIHVNNKFCEISKYSREELLGNNHRIINSGYHSRDFFVEMWKTISSGKIWEGEIRNRAKDGSLYWVSTTIVPFPDDEGRPYQYVSIRYETTQRKEAEEKLRVYAEKLENSNRELTEFASIAAHDLQEPLRKIEAFGDRIQNRYAKNLPEEGSDYLHRMLASANRMRKLIDDLLTYSKVASRKESIAELDLNSVIADVVADLEITIEKVKGKIEFQNLPKVQGDLSQYRQLFQNLISNALKFHKKDAPPIVKISGENKGGVVEIRVKDNGIGFDMKYADKIFTIFQRLHGKQEYEGTGVGLAVCRRIVERTGGSIIANSEEGKGTEITIRLPMKRGQF